MQLSKMLIASGVVLAAALSLAQANYQGANYPDSQRPNSCHNCPSAGHSNSNGLQHGGPATNGAANYQQAENSYEQSHKQGYNSHANQQKPYGPYHSYAVRPAIYGGHRMYHYKGYARQHAKACNGGYNCGSSHGLRPVNALVLAPAYGSGYGNYLPARHHQVRTLAQRPRYGRAHGRSVGRRPRGYANGARRQPGRHQSQHGQRRPRNHSAARYNNHKAAANHHRHQSKKSSSGGY